MGLFSKKPKKQVKTKKENSNVFPEEFPFWGRLKFEKNRTVLVIDEVVAPNKKTKKEEPHFVNRETTTKPGKNREEIKPSPDPKLRAKDKNSSTYLKRPQKTPKRLIRNAKNNWDMPQNLKDKYSKNNKK